MRRSAPFLLSALLAACTAPDAPRLPLVSHVVRHAPSGSCRVGPDGGPLIADRGIGGTGAPLAASGTKLADRGIGGTGIVGIVTGFASVCVNGLEVQYDSTAAIDADGAPARAADLRVGQVVAIQSAGPGSRLAADTISVRRELMGRIEGVAADTALVTIAGQPVAVRSDTEGADRFGAGDWVAVSGLWRPDGVLSATRIEAAPPGRLLAHGQVSLANGVAKVGTLVLPREQAAVVMPGQRVAVTGSYTGTTPRVTAVSRDMLLSNPASYFGDSAARLVLQGFPQVAGGNLRLPGLEASAAPGLRARVRRDEPAVIVVERRPDGSYAATGLRYPEPARASFRRGRAPGNLAVGVTPVAAPLDQPSASPSANDPVTEPNPAPEIEPDLLTSLLDTPVWPPVTTPARSSMAAPDMAAPRMATPQGTAPAVPPSAAGGGGPDDPVHPAVMADPADMLMSHTGPVPGPDTQGGGVAVLLSGAQIPAASKLHPMLRRRFAAARRAGQPAAVSLVAATARLEKPPAGPDETEARHGTEAHRPAEPPAAD